MKKIVIISMGDETGITIKKQLEGILDNKIYIETYNISQNINFDIDWDLVVFSSEAVKEIALKRIKQRIKYIVVKRVIGHEFIDRLLNLKKGENILLVNDLKESCYTVIKQLKSQGIDHVNYYPYYPGIESYEKTDIAVTPGESHLVPKEINKVIDIKSRKMDITSLTEVLINLGDIDNYGELLSSYFYRDMISISKKYLDMAHKSLKLKDMVTSILDNQKNGIIYTDLDNKVLVLNEEALKILNLGRHEIISKNIYEMFDNLKNEMANINGQEFLINKEEIKNNGVVVGNMIVINYADNIHKIDEDLRRKRKDEKLNAKYTFENIIGNCEITAKNIKLAKKVAKTNSTVLIQGETGTGKEILAQAIHNESERCEYPFVAVNFAALSESLIESELFGYEDGAFTGAKKGGKVGLFKKAHKGTIFLDGIGDASLHLQARLLRVLQEREITPVGSTEVVPVDIRIIAATNKNLLKEVGAKKFREDLYYRLNVMPIYSIPLRERKEDIKLMLQHYIIKFGVNENIETFFSKDALILLENYRWPGNIRELINIVEYLVSTKEDNVAVKIEDLPRDIQASVDKLNDLCTNNYIDPNNKNKNSEGDNKGIDYNINEIDLREEELWVLKKIYKHEGIGRRALSIIAFEENLRLGEGKLRRIMNQLKEKEFIEINKGINGTKILSKGIERVKKG